MLTQIKSVIQHAENPLKETRVVDEFSIAQWARQGDVYIERIAKVDDWKQTTNRQLAPGMTQGSRHTVDASVVVLVNPQGAPIIRSGDKFRCVGPQIVSLDRFTISHPEHADFSLPAGTYQISFQVDAKSMQRVRD